MKKNDILLILAVVVVIVLGCFVFKGEKPKASYELPLKLEGEAGLHELSYSEYQEKIDNNEAFVVIIERETCSHCQNFLPVAKSFAEENNLPMYYVDTDTFSEEDWSTFETSNTFLKKNAGNWGTPTTLVLSGNTSVKDVVGETDGDSLMNLYKKYFDLES